MRHFFVLFVLAWLLGVASGFNDTRILGVIFIATLVLLAIFCFPKFSVHFYIATASIFLVSYIYGLSFTVQRSSCEMPNSSVDGLIKQVAVKIDKTQYVVSSNSGCTFLVYASRYPEYLVGQYVVVSGGTIQTPDEISEDFAGYAEYLENQHIHGAWYQPVITAIDTRHSVLDDWRVRVKNVVRDTFLEPDASFVSAILFAESGTIPEQLKQQFRDTGVAHVLAISGLHMSLITGSIYLALLLFPLPKIVRSIIAVLLIWGYIYFIGAPISVVRAGVFWTVALLAWYRQVLISLPTVVLITASVLTGLYPPILNDVGFQLSLAAVVGIGLAIFITKPIHDHDAVSKFRWLWSSLIVSIGAMLGTWPIVVSYFGTFSPISVVANILIVPTIAPIIFLSVFSMLILPLSQLGSWVGAYLVHILISWTDMVTRLLSQIPLVVWKDMSIDVKYIAIYYVLLIFVLAKVLARQKRSWREIWQ